MIGPAVRDRWTGHRVLQTTTRIGQLLHSIVY